MLTGDYLSHNIWAYKKENHKKVIETLNELFNYYLPNIPIYWGIGNHEGVPANKLINQKIIINYNNFLVLLHIMHLKNFNPNGYTKSFGQLKSVGCQ